MATPMFSHFISNARGIKESGRWAALNDRIEELAANPGAGNEWHVQIYGQLCAQVFGEFLALDQAMNEPKYGDVSLLAWRARNIFELSIWTHFLAHSRDNARRLYEDAGRDAHELFATFEKWGQNYVDTPDWLEQIATGKTDLAERAAAEGIADIDGRYMRVDKAAEECGLGDLYKITSKLLSKFVHPTALQILGISDDAQVAKQRECFFGLGCLFFAAAFDALEKHSTMGLVNPSD